jgi:uncharacterized protein YjbJ (UPF0337 family)
VNARTSPGSGEVVVAGTTVRKGSRVRLTPGHRRADAHDMFLVGRTALVEAVLLDVEGGCHLAVTLEDDPGADLRRAHGRYLYFAPDEVEPITGERGHGNPLAGDGREAAGDTREAAGDAREAAGDVREAAGDAREAAEGGGVDA